MGILGAKREITESTFIQRKDNLLFSEIQDEIVALNVDTSEYIGFNSVGSRIWTIIEHPVSFVDLLARILKEFEVDPEQAKTDSVNFLEKLLVKKLITIK